MRLRLLALAVVLLSSCHWELNRAGGPSTASIPSGPETSQGSLAKAPQTQESNRQPLQQEAAAAPSGGSCHRQ